MHSAWFQRVRSISLYIFLIGALFFSLNQDALGAEGINRQIPFHGELVDAKGKPLDGAFDMTFAIYDAPTGGTILWDGVYTSGNGNPVTVEDGEFRVLLGSGTGNTLDLEFNDDTYYLGITVADDDEMTPRERMGATGYAINADMLDGLNASNFFQQDTEIALSIPSDASILTLTQQGGGDIMSLFNSNSSESIFSVSNSGRVIASSIETWNDSETNIFAGPLSIESGDSSSFGGDIALADGAKLKLGNGNGIGLYQDISILGSNGLMFLPEGNAILEGSVHLLAPQSFILSANTNADRTGTLEPSLELSQAGTVSFRNTAQGDPGNRYIEFDFTDGVKVPQGFMRIGPGDATAELDVEGAIRSSGLSVDGTMYSSGLSVDGTIYSSSLEVGGTIFASYSGLEVTGVVAASSTATTNDVALDVYGTTRSSSLSGGGVVNLSADADGVIIPVYSDARLKQNIQPIRNGLDTVLKLNGVRYEWKDTKRFGDQVEVGFIAQELQSVLPEVVREGREFLAVNMQNIVAVVVEAVKELNAKTEDYFTRTERLEREVELLRREIEVMKNGSADAVESEAPCITGGVVGEEILEIGPVEDIVSEPETVPELLPEADEEVQL